ncbi:MAG: hypothetical protein WCY77_03270 [Weeksellaceae bacterium]
MDLKNIDSLADLRAAKKELKFRMAMEEQEAKQGFLYSTVNKLFHKMEDTSIVQNSTIGSGVHNTLNFLSEKAESKFQLNKTTKTILSVAIMLAVPIITKKIQEFIDDKI